MQKLDASELPIKKILSSDYDFVIPPYQRPYAWETEQAEQLLEDLDDALLRDPDQPYFLGSIVLVKESGQAKSEVIDGQQRLTTLTILLSVLRDLEVDDALRAEVDTMVREPGSMIASLPASPRLRLRPKDAAFFAKNVQEPDATSALADVPDDSLVTDAQRAIKANALALRLRLADRTAQERLALLGLISERTYLVVVSTPDDASAHRIFGVMNARGLDLSPTDIFKSQLIGAIDEVDETAYTEKWEAVEESLGRDVFEDLFLHVRMIWSKERGRRELLKEFPEQVLDQFLPGKAREFIDEVVEPYGDALAVVNSASYTASKGAEGVNRSIRRLRQLDNSDWKPAAMWALRHHPHDVPLLTAFLAKLERLAASMFIRRVYTTPRVMRYGELLRQLDDGKLLDAPAFDLSEEEQKETLDRLDGDVYLVTKLRKYVLLRLDEALSEGAGVTHEHDIITVEHVLPQNPPIGSEWLADFSDDERKIWTHRLANLVLLNRSKNSAAGVLPFGEKKSKYIVGRKGIPNFSLTIQVLDEDEWNSGLLEERQAVLLGILREQWSLG